MKTLYTIIIISYTSALSAQDWCHQGSTWTYNYWDMLSASGYLRYTYTKDTAIQGQICHQLAGSGMTSIDPYQHANSYGYATRPAMYTFSKNDTVFYWSMRDSTFLPTYFFNVHVHDTIHYVNFTNLSFSAPCDTSLFMVDSVGIDTINGVPLRFYEIHDLNPNAYYFERFRITERLGDAIKDAGRMTYPCNITDDIAFGLRCYQDDSFPAFLTDTLIPCDFTTSIFKIAAATIDIYPNPVSDFTSIDYSVDYDYSGNPILEVYNVLAQLCLHETFNSVGGKYHLDTRNLPAGVYSVCIKGEGTLLGNGRFIKATVAH